MERITSKIDRERNAKIKIQPVKRSDAIPRDAFLIADKYSLSNRALIELAAAFMAAWTDFDTLNLSVKTTERRRRSVRRLRTF